MDGLSPHDLLTVVSGMLGGTALGWLLRRPLDRSQQMANETQAGVNESQEDLNRADTIDRLFGRLDRQDQQIETLRATLESTDAANRTLTLLNAQYTAEIKGLREQIEALQRDMDHWRLAADDGRAGLRDMAIAAVTPPAKPADGGGA